jgi:predicted PurR-regulated permease PerM
MTSSSNNASNNATEGADARSIAARATETSALEAQRPAMTLTGDGGLLPPVSRSQVRPWTVVVVILTALLVLGALYLLWQLSDIIKWVFVAAFLAVALNPAVRWLQRRRVPRLAAIGIVFLALVLVVAGIGALVLPPLVQQVREIGAYLIDAFKQPGGLNQVLQDVANRLGLGAYVDEIRAQLAELPARLGGAAGPLLAVTGSIIGSITALVSVLLLTFFLLKDGERFVEAGLNLIPQTTRSSLRHVLEESTRAVSNYITGNLLISLIAGVTVYIVMLILGMPYAITLALVVAVLDLIPLVGATLGAIIVILVALFINPVWALILLIYFLVYQQIENNFLQPLIYGRSVHLPPLVVFLAVLIGAQLLGILGALLAIPVAEMIRIALAEWLAARARKTGGTPPSVETSAPVDEVVAEAAGPQR